MFNLSNDSHLFSIDIKPKQTLFTQYPKCKRQQRWKQSDGKNPHGLLSGELKKLMMPRVLMIFNIDGLFKILTQLMRIFDRIYINLFFHNQII